MDINLSTGLLIGATVANGIAAGVALDVAIKQLPARQRIGPAPYRDYACAADLRNGLAWYPVLDRFARIHAVRTAAIVTTLAAVTWVLATLESPRVR